MNWVLKILGFKSEIEKKKEKLSKLQKKAFDAQRNGNLRLAGQYLSEAEKLETEIVDGSENEKR